MSLMVSIIPKERSINIDTNYLENQIPAPHNHLFGFESCRRTLWGNDVMSELGCKLIYSLKDGNIYAFDEGIEELRNELLTLLDNINLVKLRTGYGNDNDSIEFRVGNALEMIKVALKEKDKVGIAIW
ncbi:hypothetical protein [Paenibacillus sp. NFR01]|uniref:hypothetical protein n=1 Tax=Paenibacillus sp. NFR01 TaxID=1566279 RepID=UPI0008CAA4BC|nr:hypothetical protein [Paenibacillus sp. NFR01]SES88464.1 hypothetical protein SAMN03159358_0202 [Paenibacillus sp. NFR01]